MRWVRVRVLGFHFGVSSLGSRVWGLMRVIDIMFKSISSTRRLHVHRLHVSPCAVHMHLHNYYNIRTYLGPCRCCLWFGNRAKGPGADSMKSQRRWYYFLKQQRSRLSACEASYLTL